MLAAILWSRQCFVAVSIAFAKLDKHSIRVMGRAERDPRVGDDLAVGKQRTHRPFEAERTNASDILDLGLDVRKHRFQVLPSNIRYVKPGVKTCPIRADGSYVNPWYSLEQCAGDENRCLDSGENSPTLPMASFAYRCQRSLLLRSHDINVTITAEPCETMRG